MIILAIIIHIILILAMNVAVICLENDCKKIVFWNLIIVCTSIVGFIVYFIWFCDKPRLKNNIKTKFEQDEIYKNLIEFKISNTKSNNETINFNKRHYSADIFKNCDIQIFDNHEVFFNNFINDIEQAEEYIILDNLSFLMGIKNDSVISLLKEKQLLGVQVKCIYDKRKFSDRKLIKELREGGIRVCEFNKYDKFNKYYKNSKNIIVIDGVKAYIYNSVECKSKDKPISCSNLYYKLQGEVVKSIDLDSHLDVSFATQKYYELEHNQYEGKGELEMQYVSSVADKDFEGLFLKAINDAKKQIIIHINKFVPTPAIKQALIMATLSGIDVKIMISKQDCSINYYASRAYLKEMAMYGANAYIFDGVIVSNFIVIDNLTFMGNFSLVNLEIRNNLQNVLIINNHNFSSQTQNYFNDMLNNSYRICKPKNVLFREKIFKKFK